MMTKISRRVFAATASAGLLATHSSILLGQARDTTNQGAQEEAKSQEKEVAKPREAAFTRDYDAPKFKPSWKNEQINRELAADFVIYAHSDLSMVEKLYEREPGLLNATLDWGNGDWETALGGASHMGRKDIAKFLLSKGARIDLFCATMMGMLPAVEAMLELEPKLIDAKGPHGFNLHWHAQVGQEDAKPVLDYLQSIKEVKLRPVPFLKKKKEDNAAQKKGGDPRKDDSSKKADAKKGG